MSIETNIDELQPWIASYLDKLDNKNRKRLLSKVGRRLAINNRKRMTAQTDPDGQAWAPRKISPLREKVKQAKLVFTYKSSTHTRNVALKNYRDDGDRYIGWDLFADGIREFFKTGISKERHNARSASLGLRSKKMFVESRKMLRHAVLSDQIRVGWKGKRASKK